MADERKLDLAREKRREYERLYYQRTREKRIAATLKWRENHPEKYKDACKKVNSSQKTKDRLARWRAENPDKVAAAHAKANDKDPGKNRTARMRARKIAADPVGARLDAARKVAEWREKNRGLYEQQQKEWRAANRELVLGYCVQRRTKLKSIGRLSRGLSKRLLMEQGWKCPYCPSDFHEVPFAQDHFIPVKRGGPNEDWNIQLVCKPCNSKKAAKDPADFLKEIFPD